MYERKNNQKPRTIRPFLFFMTILICFYLQAAAQPENVIIVSVDTLRADHLRCYGYPLKTSVNIDSLAEDGVVFDQCYSLTPLTTASFSTMITSLPPQKHGAKRNGLGIYPNIKTLPYYLKRYGYRTAAVVSNGALLKKSAGLHKSFDFYYEIITRKRWWGIMGPEGDAADVTRKAVDWLNRHKKKRFFLWVHYTDPHIPYVQHKKFVFNYSGIPDSTYPPGSRMGRIKKYDSEIAYTDFHIGKLFKVLKNLKLYEKSLIIFHSDHGESFGEHNYVRHGRKLYNSCLHVPLIVKLPENRSKGSRRKENVCMLDIAPTIFNSLDLLEPDQMEGLPLFDQNSQLHNRQIIVQAYKGKVHLRRNNKKFQLKVEPVRYAIIKGSTKLIYNKRQGTYEAYSLKDDPFEARNISITSPTKIAGLKETLVNRIDYITRYIELNRIYRLGEGAISGEDMILFTSQGYAR